MEKEFVNYNQALKLKSLGFDEDCLARYEGKITHIEKPLVFEFTFANLPGAQNKVGYPNYPYKDVEAPTFSQAFRWFREKYDLYSWIHLHNGYLNDSYYKKLPITWTVMEHESGKQYYERDIDHNYLYNTPEEAELACLDKLIEIVENKK
jgi:hypothetical protein